MESDDIFAPETVEEQMDQLTTASYPDSPSPNVRMMHELQAYYEEGQRATEHVWQRLAYSIAEQERDRSPSDLLASSPIQQNSPEATKRQPSLFRSIRSPHLASLVALLITALVVSSLLWIGHARQLMQLMHSAPVPQGTEIIKQEAKTPGVYFIKIDGIDKRDIKTGKVLWHVAHSFQGTTKTPVVSINGVLYLLDDYTWNKIVALDAETGKERWSHTFDTMRTAQSIRPVLINGLLYFSGSRINTVSRDVLGGQDVVYAINPADGAIKATYKAPSTGWHDLVIQDQILYYTVDHPGGTDLYAAQLPGGTVLWHKPAPSTPQTTDTNEYSGVGYTATAGDKRYESHNGKVYAFDVQTGKQVWMRPYDTFDLKATPQTLYLSYIIAGTSHRGLAALNAKDGTTLWQRDIPQISFFSGTFYIHLVNGVLYDVAITGDNITVSDPFLYAVDATDGNLLWKIALKNQANIDSIIDIIG